MGSASKPRGWAKIDMSPETEAQSRRIPTLVSYCQRVLSTHADAISCLGDIRYELIKPVLECCSADTLLRLEQSSPYLVQNTSDLWEHLSFKMYPLLAEQLIPNDATRPDSWREQFFLLQEAEALRLEEVTSKLRSQRMEAAERKKEREVKLTDRLPPTKRARMSIGQPKSLFQKAKDEAKLRGCLYGFHHKTQYKPHRHFLDPPTKDSSAMSVPSTLRAQNTVKTSPVKCPPTSTLTAPVQTHNSTPTSPSTPKKPTSLTASISPISALVAEISPTQSESRSSKPLAATAPAPAPQKKDPMASLFMPKHRAFSQLPSQVKSVRTMPSR